MDRYAGSDVEVAWTVKAFHGGGYAYRLCPAGSTLDEECFSKHYLDFVGQSSFRWGGVDGEQLFFDGVRVTEGTHPPNSMWSKVMIPGGPWGYSIHGASFMPVCKESEACTSAIDKKAPFMTCKCAGEGVGDIPTLEVVDKVKIPKDLPAGDWVLSWRWVSLLPSFVRCLVAPRRRSNTFDRLPAAQDCEESTQVWNSCADVTIKH